MLGESWWWSLPAAAAGIAIACSVIFTSYARYGPDVIGAMLINAAFFSAAYAFVVLLAPGFQLKHFACGFALQFLAPFSFGFVEPPLGPWLIAQWIVTAVLMLLYRVIVVPKWRHECFSGQVRQSFSIRSLMMLTLFVAIAIVILQVAQMPPDYYLIVLMLCGPPLLGWLSALLMTQLRLQYVYLLLGLAVILLATAGLLDGKSMFRLGLEIEPLWMLSSAIGTMIVTSLLQLPFQLRSERSYVAAEGAPDEH